MKRLRGVIAVSEAMRHEVVIVGGGTAGITVAVRLKRASDNLDIAIIKPSEKHYYQPLWTLIGDGAACKEQTEREEKDFIPEGLTWVKEYVAEFDPEQNEVVTRSGKRIEYQYLVVAPGIQINWK